MSRLHIIMISIAACAFGVGLDVLLHLVGASRWLLIVPPILVLLFLVSFAAEVRAANGRNQHKQRDATNAAERRGRELLMRLLTPEQRRQYRQTQTITVDIPGGHKALISDAAFSGVQWHTTQSGRPRSVSQCVSVTNVSRIDDLIGKLLALRTDPKALANLSGMDIYSDGVGYNFMPARANAPRTSIPDRFVMGDANRRVSVTRRR